MQPNFGLLDTQTPERISRNVLAIQAQNENQQMNRLRLQSEMEDRQMRNALAQQGLQQRQQEHSMAMIPKIAQLLYADPSDNTIDALAQVYSQATGQDVSQFAGQLKQMPTEQRKQVALAMGQKYDPEFQVLNLGDKYQGVQVGSDGMVPVGEPLLINRPQKEQDPQRINNPTTVKGKDGVTRFWDGSGWKVIVGEDGSPFLSARENPESRQDLSAADAAGKATVARQEDAAKSEKKIGSLTEALKSARDILAPKSQSGQDLPPNVTASGAGAIADKITDFAGVGTESKTNAGKLDLISGWMTANVPRMEGPQSDYDVQNYKTMAGQVGDRNIPVSTRLGMLDELEKLQNKYAHLNKQYAERKPAATGKIQFLGFE